MYTISDFGKLLLSKELRLLGLTLQVLSLGNPVKALPSPTTQEAVSESRPSAPVTNEKCYGLRAPATGSFVCLEVFLKLMEPRVRILRASGFIGENNRGKLDVLDTNILLASSTDSDATDTLLFISKINQTRDELWSQLFLVNEPNTDTSPRGTMLWLQGIEQYRLLQGIIYMNQVEEGQWIQIPPRYIQAPVLSDTVQMELDLHGTVINPWTGYREFFRTRVGKIILRAFNRRQIQRPLPDMWIRVPATSTSQTRTSRSPRPN